MPGCTIISTVSGSFAYLTIILMKYLVCQKASKIGLVSASQFALVVSLNWWAVPASTIWAYSKFGGSSSPLHSIARGLGERSSPRATHCSH
jgi:hypothetical protein